MSKHRLKNAIDERRTALGVYSRAGSPALIELMGYIGLDYAVVDLEHTSIDLVTVEQMVRAASLSGMSLLVRIPEEDYGMALRVLDIGSNGVVFPHVNTKDDALKAVSIAKYMPLGKRGMFRSRKAFAEGKDFATYCREANEGVIVAALIEEKEGVDNIDEILSIEGIDVIDTGPNDLSQSLGVQGQTGSPVVVNALTKVYDACASKGKPVVIAASFGTVAIKKYCDKGASLLIELGNDETIFCNALKNLMAGAVAGPRR